jgi:integrase/recombinase XerD
VNSGPRRAAHPVHQDVSSTMKYLHADLKLKERALDRTAAAEYQLGRYQPSDTVLDFLDSLTTPARK